MKNVLIYVFGHGAHSIAHSDAHKIAKNLNLDFESSMKRYNDHQTEIITNKYNYQTITNYHEIIPVVMNNLNRKILKTIFSPIVKIFPPFSKKNEFLIKTLSNVLQKLQEGKKVTLVGHSAGGALVNRVSQELFNLFYEKYKQNTDEFSVDTPLGHIKLVDNKKNVKELDLDKVSLNTIKANLQIATIGSICIWNKKWNRARLPKNYKIDDIFGNIKMYNYMSISDVSKFCVGLRESWCHINSDNGFDGLVITKLYTTEYLNGKIPLVLCKCFYDNPLQNDDPYNNVIPICLYKSGVSPEGVSPEGVSSEGVSPEGVSPEGVSPEVDYPQYNIKICDQHIEWREHNDYDFFFDKLLLCKNVNIYDDIYINGINTEAIKRIQTNDITKHIIDSFEDNYFMDKNETNLINNFYDRIEMTGLLTDFYIKMLSQNSRLPPYSVDQTGKTTSAGGGVRRKRTNKRKYNTHVFTRKRKQNTRKITKSKLRKTRRM
jgi:hypothetical protein